MAMTDEEKLAIIKDLYLVQIPAEAKVVAKNLKAIGHELKIMFARKIRQRLNKEK